MIILEIIKNNLSVLQVVLPLMAVTICWLITKPRCAWAVSLITSLLTLSISIALIYQVHNYGIITYNLGGWLTPYGIELRIDLLNSMLLVLVNFITVVSVIYGLHINEKEIETQKISSFYGMFLLALSGLIGILITNDAFNIYVFLEITSISSYVLVAMGQQRSALLSAFEYLINSTIGATFYLLGVGFLYSATGTLNITDLHFQIQELENLRIIQVGALFIITGLLIKVASFPFHTWLINSYSSAPSFISVFLSGTATKTMLYVIIKLTMVIFNPNFLENILPISNIMLVLSLGSIIFASIFAIFQRDVKKLFAYSSISQTGYITLAMSLNSHLGMSAAVIHIINHSITKAGLFMIAGSIKYGYGSTGIENLRGLNKVIPCTMVALLALILSMIGVPLTVGFTSKWYILEAIVTSEKYWIIWVFLAGSVLSIIYMWKIIESVYFSSEVKEKTNIPWQMSLCVWITVALSIGLGAIPIVPKLALLSISVFK